MTLDGRARLAARSAPIHATLKDWIAREAIPFAIDSPETFNAAVDKMIASLGLPTRSGSTKNPTYFALTPQSFADFDGLIALDSTTYNRGGPLAATTGR
jgi:hypothetical protein